MSSATPSPAKTRMRVFRAAEARNMPEEIVAYEGLTPVDHAGLAQMRSLGGSEGSVAKALFSDPVSGMSLGYAWFKANYVLPRHSHDADCLYYVISGEIHLGAEILKPGDGFFVPADGLYQYHAGPEGVEVLEFRTAATYNMVFSGNGQAVWDRIRDNVIANLGQWRTQPVPEAARRMS